MADFKLLTTDQYYESLLTEIPGAKRRVVISAMVVLWGKRTAAIFSLLEKALSRGVHVTVLLDKYTRLTYLHQLGKGGSKRLRQTDDVLAKLRDAGAHVYTFGKLGLIPQKGRCHVKITVVDNRWYSFGGVNFIDEAFNNADYMLTGENAQIANRLAEMVDLIATSRPPLFDNETRINDHGSILFDGGQARHSIIYERACELASQSKRVWFTSQMTPSGQLARLLHETKATVYTNAPEVMGTLEGAAQAYDMQKYRIKNAYKGHQYVHAKVMLFELASGKKALLSGSHNFSYRGVEFGTQEIALQSTDPKLWELLHDFIQKNVSQEG